MNIDKLEGIKMSVMVSYGGIDQNNKTDYLLKKSGDFRITEEFYKDLKEEEKENLTQGLVNAMYDELQKLVVNEDSIGLWIDYDGETLENSMKLSVLEDMKKFGSEDVDPIYEFFKMTLENNRSNL